MDDTFDKEENQKNIYVIKHKLAELKKWPGSHDWTWEIGDFQVVMRASDETYFTAKAHQDDSVVRHEKLHVSLYETTRANPKLRNYVNLRDDSRFKNYKPIQYNLIETPTGGCINLSDGREMPLIYLCELIRYLYRLSNLTVFL